MPTPLRLLSLEDNESDLQLILLELQEAGFEPRWERVQTERDFVERLDQNLDIILADYSLPQFDAMKALRLRNERGVDVPFIIVSGSIGEDIAVVAMQEGAADYVLKDRLGRLGQAVTRALEQKRLTTERKRAEQALLESDARMRIVTDNARVGLVMVNQERRYIFANATYSEVLGLPASEILGRRVHEVLPEMYEEQIRPRLDRAFAGERVAYELKQPAQGGDRYYAVTYEPRKVGDLVSHVVVVIVDITERKQAEIASHQQQNRLAGIVNSALDGIITIGEDQRIILINPAAEAMFGVRSDGVLGQWVDRFIPERFRSTHQEYVRQFDQTSVADRPMGPRPVTGIRANGKEFPLEASISQLEMDGTKLFTVICRDVTERVRANETKQKLEAQLVQSQKMEAFGQLAGGIAHDFNNLLCVISGYSEMLLGMLPANDPKRNLVKAIGEAGSRAESLTRQLLAFSRKTVLEPKVLDLNEIVRETEKMLGRLLGEDIILTTLPDVSIRHVKVDPGLMGQVLMNLAVNARDAMPRGGKLNIETANVELQAPFHNAIGDFKPGWYVMLAVSDTGCGMTPEIKARIFEPFFTTKGVGKGTGLGLAVVHGIVSQSAGQIEIESEPGRGTTFRIYLPAVEEQVSTWKVDEPGKDLRGNETILLVEDEENVRELASLVLQSYGYQVLVAEDGRDALRFVENRQSGIDLLLTDVVMPHLSGRELADILQPRFPQMKVLYMTGYTDDAVVRHGLVQGQVPLLQKPATPIQLATKVRCLLDSAG